VRRWRSLDLGSVRAYLEAEAPRVRCVEHGVVVASVPWARHNTGHTRYFDDTVAWLAVACSKTAVTDLMRIAWRTVGAIIARVSADIDARVDRNRIRRTLNCFSTSSTRYVSCCPKTVS
jgi:transposase